MIKISAKGYGTFILLGIVANVLIFYFFSRQLEDFIYYKTTQKYSVEKSLSNELVQSQKPF